MLMMKEDGMRIGRFKVRKLMREMNLISKQPGSHAYKKATVEQPNIPNVLDRGFNVTSPNKVWWGDITYVLAEGRWHYLAAVIDLYARRSGQPIRQPEFRPETMEIPLHAEHESARQLPRQRADGAAISQPEN